MQAMILKEPKPAEADPLQLAELPTPEPGPGQIRIRIRVCGVCHTDLHTVEGDLDLPKLPVVPGHEIIGQVESLGAGVTRFREGDRVGVPWVYATCGRCRYCCRGDENLCDSARFTGYHVDGGYAQYMVIDQDFAHAIATDLPDAQAAPLMCAGIIGYRALRLSRIGPGERLGLYGFGGSAHIAIQVAVHWGCRVYVFTRSPEHRRLAQELGAVWVGRAEQTPPEKLDSAVIFAPVGRLVPEALRVLDKGGTVALAGITMSPIPELDYDKLLYEERVLRSVTAATRKDAEELLALAGEIPIRTEVREFDLTEANTALQMLKASRLRATAVLRIPPATGANA